MAKTKPTRYRNISDSDKTVHVGGRYQLVPIGGEIEAGDTGTYWQTGEQGETPLWEVVGGASRTSAPQTDAKPVDEPPAAKPVDATDDDKKES